MQLARIAIFLGIAAVAAVALMAVSSFVKNFFNFKLRLSDRRDLHRRRRQDGATGEKVLSIASKKRDVEDRVNLERGRQ
jgi:hypothetical protein